ncbi:cysteine--tRNA ligase [uncultured Paludibaculum sp.]|uniref:cysteine--tRNA ligase n=1 Tax=uncultured Paludibaculum sp. TaxID=1765020 RepID=UPI002AAC29A8|nr:cysteine--tRNA ligase [uncultured Paludibaculum sp.]
MALRFYNTLTQELEEFQPLDGKTVRMYTCGPTVYSFVHIGNFRTFSFQDILRRTLAARGYTLNHVMNITDVEDKIIRNALAAGQTIQEYTAPYTQAFKDDSASLRLQQPERWVLATEHIPEMVSAIERLAVGQHTYQNEGSTYFRISTFPEYGKLSHTNFSGNIAGARVEVDEYDKADARDFVLWKAQKPGEPAWQTPLGEGRPGWHIECSVMAMKYLGETIDIHTGGVDLVFPHHENEIAQSEAITGKRFVRYWLHAEHLMVEGQKMSKSLGNFYTLRDIIEKGYSPEAIRYLLVSAHYRKQLNFTFEGLRGAAASLERLRNFELRLKNDKLPEGVNPQVEERTTAAWAAFNKGLDDDLNTSDALAAIYEYVRDANTAMDAGQFQAGNAAGALALLTGFDAIFDVLKPTIQGGALSDADIDAKVAERTKAKKAKDFKLADALRNELLELGIVLEDTKDGVRWKRK